MARNPMSDDYQSEYDRALKTIKRDGRPISADEQAVLRFNRDYLVLGFDGAKRQALAYWDGRLHWTEVVTCNEQSDLPH